MLERTFIHIHGIGPRTEKRLWREGVRNWEDFLHLDRTVFSPLKDRIVREELECSRKHLNDAGFFSDRLCAGEMWRLFEAFKYRTAYLDIETSGGYEGADEITVIGVYDGSAVYSFVNGSNLDRFETAIARYQLVVTFNGSTFDLPFIRRTFPGITLPPAHVDLRFLLKRLGYKGGLKKIEEDFGLIRRPGVRGLNGYDAVLMWRAYREGDAGALARLLEYNRADIVHLKPLMEHGYREMREKVLT